MSELNVWERFNESEPLLDLLSDKVQLRRFAAGWSARPATFTDEDLRFLKVVLARHHDQLYRSRYTMSRARGDEQRQDDADRTRRLYALVVELLGDKDAG